MAQTQRITATVNTNRRLFESPAGGLCYGWEEFQGVTVYVTTLAGPTRRTAVSVQGHEADGCCATWDNQASVIGTESYDLAEAWLNDKIPCEVFLDWLRDHDLTGELEALLEAELEASR